MEKLESRLILFTAMIMFTIGLKTDHMTSYDIIYDLGMDAYKQEKWAKCSEFFTSAVNDYHYYKNTVIDCRLQCKKKQTESSRNNGFYTFHDILVESNCLRRCKKKELGQRAEEEISVAVDRKFEDRNPYNFMQFCLFKNDKPKEAAAAAYTYYIAHQDDNRIIENIQFYRNLPEVSDEDFVDLERKKFQTQYVNGLEAYNDGRWMEAAEALEESLRLYYTEEERCRTGCERGFTHNGFPDFINAIADHYVTVIVCQQKCLRKLSTFGMEELENFVAEHYNYLQYSYYEANNLEKAFESIASYLLFRPNDEEMLHNKDYYIKIMRHKESEFVPSKDAVRYIETWNEISRSLDFVREKYTLPSDELHDNEEKEEDEGEHEESEKVEVERAKRVERFEKIGVKLLQQSHQLKGSDRFVADGFIRGDQCEALADLARSREYNESGSREISLTEALQLVKTDEDYEISLRLLLRAVDVMKAYSSIYFNQSGMLAKEVKVVCRSPGVESDSSLPEDCILQETGDCKKAETQKYDFMAVAYLTEMVDGTGQFYFTGESGEPQVNLEPLCGLVVGFSGKSSHQVNLPWKHERCALVLTFNTDSSVENKDLPLAKVFLEELETKHAEEFSREDKADILQQFYGQGVKIVMSGEELHGKERFVADGLSTAKECETLIHLARHDYSYFRSLTYMYMNEREGLSGDGYAGRVSPHTDFEIFIGLDVKHAQQLGVTEGDGYNSDQATNPAAIKFVSPYSEFEIFEGLNITRSLKLIEEDVVPVETIQLFLDISEHGRLLVEKYFNLTKRLYFDYTHLVCRTALDREGDVREDTDLSHPVHSDNCMIQDDGSCVPDPLAYVQRHYSAVMYLNEDFEGGQFFFAHRNKSEQISLRPKCGRIVAFNAGEYHGVKAVTKGQRCAIAMWYTHDPNYVEVARLHTQRTIDKVVKKKKEKESKDKKDKELTDKEGFSEGESVDVNIQASVDTAASVEENHDEL